MKTLVVKKVIGLLLVLLIMGVGPATAAPAEEWQLSGVVKYVDLAGGFYGIAGDDGVKYQPSNLPYKFRKDGLAVKFKARSQEDKVNFLMWGTAMEIITMNPVAGTVSDAERTALYVMQKRLDAYNAKDLQKLQQIDLVARELSQEQFESWLGQYENFTLRYLEVTTVSGVDITGQAWYTRDLADVTGTGGVMELGIVRFTLDRRQDGWRLTALNSVPAPDEKLSLDALLEKAKAHYGLEDLTRILR